MKYRSHFSTLQLGSTIINHYQLDAIERSFFHHHIHTLHIHCTFIATVGVEPPQGAESQHPATGSVIPQPAPQFPVRQSQLEVFKTVNSSTSQLSSCVYFNFFPKLLHRLHISYWDLHLGEKHAWEGKEKPCIYVCFPLQSTCSFLIFPQPFSLFLDLFLCLSHLFTRGRRKATTRLLDLNLPHLIQCCNWMKKGRFSGAQLCLVFTTCGSSNNIPWICLFSTPMAALESCAPVSHIQHELSFLGRM